ncbi:MAG TPA: hypothetical protein VFR49_04640 [Solirubrobacteraceae bacterium]|nr:hypothetical protein [Solirubrobacteraceae bacterium]
MTTTSLPPLAADYLVRLRRAGRRLPRRRLGELVADIEEHLSETLGPSPSDADVLTVLDRLGEPEEIIAAERPPAAATAEGRGTREWSAIFLLLFGGFLVGFGWIVGLILLWSSRAWTTREKWLGTLVIPGGLATAVIVLGAAATTGSCDQQGGGPVHCTPGPGAATMVLQVGLLVIAVAGPFVTAIYLARRAR